MDFFWGGGGGGVEGSGWSGRAEWTEATATRITCHGLPSSLLCYYFFKDVFGLASDKPGKKATNTMATLKQRPDNHPQVYGSQFWAKPTIHCFVFEKINLQSNVKMGIFWTQIVLSPADGGNVSN